MWAARCAHIQNLIDPAKYRMVMEGVADFEVPRSCLGKDRFAMEHWVQSHPGTMPCDLYKEEKYTGWGSVFLPKGDFEKELRASPRFPFERYSLNTPCKLVGSKLEHRLDEYKVVYGIDPPPSWWGWEFYSARFEDHVVNS